ncbi:MAG: CocE/NonD family hydrolase [Flavobacterium sp.]
MKKLLCVLFYFSLTLLFAQRPVIDEAYMQEHYTKSEHFIPVRDGVKLYTLVYTPKDRTVKHPFLMNRTCYNASNYDNYKVRTPSPFLIDDKYILVYQDVRGRYMSEGIFDNMTPNIPGNHPKNKKDIDESSDTYDTIEWLLKNIPNNNGKVGIYGISYPGFYATAALPDAHPALKASSPQAPISDFFFDDFHHMGAFLQSYSAAFATFGYQKTENTRKSWFTVQGQRFRQQPIADGYRFHLNMGPLQSYTDQYYHDNFFWKQIIDHPNYDNFWQKRNILPHLRNVKTAVMTVGGWFDAEDLYGPLNIYKTIEKHNPNTQNTLVMGPWAHGDWARERGKQTHNHLYFGDSISNHYQRDIERHFFAHHLKGTSIKALPEAYMYDTGKKEWKSFDQWPPQSYNNIKLTFAPGGKLHIDRPGKALDRFVYVSDPNRPVPYTSQTEGLTFTPRRFMSDDQRHASTRPDVLTFVSEVLEEDTTLAGEIMARLLVSISTTDADFIVKLIDEYPQDHTKYEHNPDNIIMGGYQQLVRHETFRGRFRNSFEKPEPFVPNTPTEVEFPLQDILHTFKKGHRIVIQIHSTWFPYIDRNPQQYVENIYKAKAEDFIPATIEVLGSSVIEIGGEQPLTGRLQFLK